MIVRRQNYAILSPSLSKDQYNFGRVEEYKYLGTILTENYDTAKEIEARIQAGKNCFFGLAELLDLCQGTERNNYTLPLSHSALNQYIEEKNKLILRLRVPSRQDAKE